MMLKRLHLHGFKSFAQKTEVLFDRGITGIVGPNGCGKSNIVDAIKWVLGEQSAKSLRGKEMADVIFNGSADHEPMSFAKVALTFDNEDGALALPAQEVTIERRLYRTGQSEYALNGETVRLRDLRDLFKGTGAGMRGYSVIEQGQVEVLLTADPKSRRRIFEEAAGIGRFKEQKKAALAKLERVEQNLHRVNDVCDEVERQIRRIKSQATKARNYREFAALLKTGKIDLALVQYRARQAEREGHQRLLADARAHEQRLKADMDRLQGELGRLDGLLVGHDRRLEGAHKKILALQETVGAAEERIGVARNTVVLAERTQERLHALMEDLDRRRAELDQEARALHEQGAQTRRQREAGAVARTAAEAAQRERAALVEQLQTELNETRAQLEGHERQATRAAQELAALEGRGAPERERRDALQGALDALAEQDRQDEEARAALAERQSELEGRLATWREAHTAKNERHRAERDTVNGLSRELEAKRAEWTRLESRRATLADFLARGEGLAAGVRALREAAAAGTLPGLGPSIAEALRVRAPAVVALERLLGTRAGRLLADDDDAAHAAFAWLAEQEAGSAGLLVRSRLAGAGPRAGSVSDGLLAGAGPRAGSVSDGLLAGAGVLGRLADFVDDEEGGALAGALLAGAVLVEDDAAARALLEAGAGGARTHAESRPHGPIEPPPPWGGRVGVGGTGAGAESRPHGTDDGAPLTVVTVAGAVYEAGGAWRGGAPDADAGLISQQHECERLRREVEVRGASLAKLEEEKTKRLAVLTLLETELATLRGQLHDGEFAALDLRKETEHLDRMRARRAVEQGEAERQLAAQRTQAEAAARRTEELGRLEQAARGAAEAARAHLAERLARIQEAQQAKTDADRAAADARVEFARLDTLLGAFEKDRETTDRSLASTRSMAKSGADELAAAQAAIDEAHAVAREQQTVIAAARAERETREAELDELTRRRHQVRDEYETQSENLRAVQSEYQTVMGTVSNIEVAEHDAGARADQLCARLWEEYEADLRDLAVDRAADVIDEAAVGAQVEALAGKIKRLGNVNMEAIEELDELEGRHGHLAEQREDLRRAERQLREILRKIETTSRALFTESFTAIQENFKTLFRKLFGGGRADLLLENPEDVLESGIDILARPPGKEPRSIMLLSGGEKALTAVALLLAVFQAKPSPFAILDEVDAPLDESNVGRFKEVVQEFAQRTQFLVITHAKPTMSAAQVLYGITQEQPGISKKVAVNFEDYREPERARA